MTEFITYASCEDGIHTAIDAGADHLILEDSKLSVRCYANDFIDIGFEKYKQLADLARSLRTDIKLSVNIDKLIHDRHRPLVEEAVRAIQDASIDTVRVQDPGVAVFIASLGDFNFHLATETGNNNHASVAHYAANEHVSFQRQVLSNDWSADAIETVCSEVACEFEFQVHGPVLLQYTDRRLMSGYHALRKQSYDGRSSISSQDAADYAPLIPQRIADVEGRSYPLYDNPHGHFMYASFDKALYKQIELLKGCALTAWLFDARGESLDYLSQSLMLYRKAYADGCSDVDYQTLEQQARRRYKPGFFIANNTDYVFEADAREHAEQRIAAKVVDSIKTKSLVLAVEQDCACGVYQVLTPEGKQKKIEIKHMFDLSGNEIDVARAGQLVRIKWFKGLYVDCMFLVQ